MKINLGLLVLQVGNRSKSQTLDRSSDYKMCGICHI